jgi:HEAT repeat protein
VQYGHYDDAIKKHGPASWKKSDISKSDKADIIDPEYLKSISSPFLTDRYRSWWRSIKKACRENKAFAIENLIVALGADNPIVNENAFNALIKMNDDAIGPMINLLESKDYKLKVYAIKALGIIGDKRATLPLLKLLKEDDFYVSSLAYEALKNIKEIDIKPIINELKSEYICFIKELNRIPKVNGDIKKIKSLTLMLENNDPIKRKEAFDNMISFGDNIEGLVLMAKSNYSYYSRLYVSLAEKRP